MGSDRHTHVYIQQIFHIYIKNWDTMRKEWKRNQNSNNSFKVQIGPDLCVRVCCVLSHVRLCDPRDCSPPGSSVHGFPRQEYWSGLPFPAAWDLLDPGIEPESLESPTLQVDCTAGVISFQTLFHYRLLQDTEYSSLCYIAGPCCLSSLYIVICIWGSLMVQWQGIHLPSRRCEFDSCLGNPMDIAKVRHDLATKQQQTRMC